VAGAAHTQRRLGDDEPAERRLLTVQDLLACHPGGHNAVDHVGGDAGLGGPDDRLGVIVGLEQPGNEPVISGMDPGSHGLEVNERREPGRMSLFGDPGVRALERVGLASASSAFLANSNVGVRFIVSTLDTWLPE
jgi:hypothetical protein